MKTKAILIALITILAVTTLVFQSCIKDEEKTNQPPTCTITSPSNGEEIAKGETVIISVDANDNDGSISEVRFFINDIGSGSAASFPFNYSWNTNDESIGNHTVKATSIDNSGSSTSDEITIKIIDEPGFFTDPRDGQTYAIVDIGNQTWFAENLNYQTANSWWYDNSSATGDVYGRLYTWEAALNACPSGWHLPSDDEWKTIEMALGMSQLEADESEWRGTDEGGKLKEGGEVHWVSPNTGATNSSGFTALPGGYRPADSFFALGEKGYWWSATEYDSIRAWFRYLHTTTDQVYRYGSHTTSGFSVRCLKN